MKRGHAVCIWFKGLAAWGVKVYTAEPGVDVTLFAPSKSVEEFSKMGKPNKQRGLSLQMGRRAGLSTKHKSSFITLILVLCPAWHSYTKIPQRDFMPRSEFKDVDWGFMLFINLLSLILAPRLSFHISFFALRTGLKRYVNSEPCRYFPRCRDCFPQMYQIRDLQCGCCIQNNKTI